MSTLGFSTDRPCSHRLYQDECACVLGHYIKDLSILGRDLTKTVVLDNAPHTYPYHVSITPKTWRCPPSLSVSVCLTLSCSLDFAVDEHSSHQELVWWVRWPGTPEAHPLHGETVYSGSSVLCSRHIFTVSLSASFTASQTPSLPMQDDFFIFIVCDKSWKRLICCSYVGFE